ncbi:MAG: ribose-5-phosphate isomerase RpiA [Thermoprotei archaeon]
MNSKAKINAARRALEYVEDGDIIGVGSGSTVSVFIDELAKSGKKIVAVPTSLDTLHKLAEKRIAITTLAHAGGRLRLTVDGADQVDPQLNLIKGGGGALTREKIVAYSSELFVVIVDDSKLTRRLGLGFAVPIEFVYDAHPLISMTLSKELGCTLTLKSCDGKLSPLISDNGLALGNLIFNDGVEEPIKAENLINTVPGVLENGLFTKHKNELVIVGDDQGSRTLKR